MQQDAFEAELKSAGYNDIENRKIEPRPPNSEHVHEHDIRGLVLDGLFIVVRDGKHEEYRAGQIFDVKRGNSHWEEIGPEGAHVLVGRRYG